MKNKHKYLTLCIVFVVLILAFLFRVNFFFNYRQAPVVWDAAGYNIQAREFVAAYNAWPDREAFSTHFKKAYEMALPKCELYPLFVCGVYLVNGVDFNAVRVAQAILGTLSILILYLVAARIFNRRVALISIIIAAFYVPFVISEGRILTETLAVFVFMLTIWLLVLTIERGSWWLILLSGLATAMMVITRTFFQYIYIAYWPMLIVALALHKKRSAPPVDSNSTGKPGWLISTVGILRSFPLKSFIYIVGLAIIIVPRLFLTPHIDRHHRSFISGSWRNGLGMYCGIYPPNQGLQTVQHPGGDIFQSIKVDQKPAAIEEKYLKAYIQILLKKPAEAIPVLFAKGWLFYQRAYNDFLQSYILSPVGIDRFNRIILVAGLFGIALLLGLGPRVWPVTVSLVYGWAMCFAADAESRYTIPLMALMIMVAVWFGEEIIVGIAAHRRRKEEGRSRMMPVLIITGLLLGLSIFVRPGYLLAAIPGFSFFAAHSLWVCFFSLFLLSLIPLLFILYRRRLSGWRRGFSAAAPIIVIMLIFFSALKVHPDWHEWFIRLSSQDQVVRKVFDLPDDLENYRSADLKMDLLSGKNRYYNLIVSIDGEVIRRFEGGLTPDAASWVPPVIRRAFPTYLRETKRKISDLLQWYTIPLDLQKLRGRKSIEVEIRFIPLEEGDDCYVDLFGDYRTLDAPGIFEGPTFSKSPTKLSIYKYLIDDDWRIWERAAITPGSSESYTGFGKWREDDLSPVPGMQTGVYRICLLLSKRKLPPPGFPVAVKYQDYLTRKTILADYYNLQIWEVNLWKRKSDLMELSAAHAASGSEGGFQLVVYADTDRDEKPDKLLAESSYFTAETEGEWSSFTFSTSEKNIYVGMSWPRGSKTKVYYERALWPDDLFPETMFYRTGPTAAIAAPVLTNMRLRFLKE